MLGIVNAYKRYLNGNIFHKDFLLYCMQIVHSMVSATQYFIDSCADSETKLFYLHFERICTHQIISASTVAFKSILFDNVLLTRVVTDSWFQAPFWKMFVCMTLLMNFRIIFPFPAVVKP